MKRVLALAVSVCMALTVFAASPEIMKVVPGADAEVSAASYPALKTINYKVTGDQRKDIVGFAKTQVGYAEKSGNNTYFGAWYGMNKQPWCAMFICWAASKAGVATSIIPKLANADRGWAKKQGVYYKSRQWGGNYTPKPGDLIYFSWSVRDYADHIGMVSGTGKSGGTTYVYTIEGNKHDKVKEGSYAINNRYILGYASPKYTSSTPT
ncbi:MAG: CHAP domain-containing protein, partial [Bacillota bacterium]|nr:CHAP domain-containing protein [Bacillota bacterium]